MPTAADHRKKRMTYILRVLNDGWARCDNDSHVIYERTIGRICFDTGVTEKQAHDDLRILELVGKLRITHDDLGNPLFIEKGGEDV